MAKLTGQPNNLMQQRPSWKIYIPSTSHEIPCIWRNPQVHYHVHKSPPMVSILSQMNSVNTLPSCFSTLHLNIVLPSTPRSSKWFISFRCSYHKLKKSRIM